MTQPDLARLAGLVERVTDLPWEGEASDDYVITAAAYPKEYGGRFKEDSTGFYLATVGNHPSDYGEANRDLIVAAVNALPALLARIAALENELNICSRLLSQTRPRDGYALAYECEQAVDSARAALTLKENDCG